MENAPKANKCCQTAQVINNTHKCILCLFMMIMHVVHGGSNVSRNSLDLVLVSQHQGEETKSFFRLLPRYFDMNENRIRVAVIFADSPRPYVALNFTSNEELYQKAIETSQINLNTMVEDEVGALKMVYEQLFSATSSNNNNAKAIIFIQYGIFSQADNELIQLRSMNISVYHICPALRPWRPEDRLVARSLERYCGLIAQHADCTIDVGAPGILHGEVFQLINQTIEQKFKNGSSICGNGTGSVVVGSGIEIESVPVLVSTPSKAVGRCNNILITAFMMQSIITIYLVWVTIVMVQ